MKNWLKIQGLAPNNKISFALQSIQVGTVRHNYEQITLSARYLLRLNSRGCQLSEFGDADRIVRECHLLLPFSLIERLNSWEPLE